MKTILGYGDSNLRGTIAGPALDEKGLIKRRYPPNKRWMGVLQRMLGENYHVIEEGIGGRTTTLDDIFLGRPYRNGLKEFPRCLETHYPIDLVIFQLGTNDTLQHYQRSVAEIGEGMRQLIQVVKNSHYGPEVRAPQVLVISPQQIVEAPQLHPQFTKESIEKSKLLGAIYKKMAEEENCAFLDASEIVSSSQIDGVHLEEEACATLAKAVFEKVQQIFRSLSV